VKGREPVSVILVVRRVLSDQMFDEAKCDRWAPLIQKILDIFFIADVGLLTRNVGLDKNFGVCERRPLFGDTEKLVPIQLLQLRANGFRKHVCLTLFVGRQSGRRKA
jgi:hypothetical protein